MPRLSGPSLGPLSRLDMPSEALVRGSVQVAGDGMPTVLLSDHQTTGGYPKIATVITADLRRLAQTQAGRGFRFQAVSMAQAQAEYRAMAQLIRALPSRVVDAQASQLDIDALHSANVAGVATNAFDA